MTREDLEKRKVALLAYIHDAFKGVTREGGVSWSQAGVIDGHGTEAEEIAARESDVDTRWQDVLDDASFNPDASWGGFSFLDPIGFRYYLPPAMIRCIEESRDCKLCSHLKLAPRGDGSHGWTLKKWSLLSRKQSLCVKAFIQYMIDLAEVSDLSYEREWWTEALDSHWGTLP